MRKVFCFALIIGVTCFLAGISLAEEHPAHGIAPGKAMKEQPGGATLTAKDVIGGIEGHINSVTKANNGVFAIKDEAEGKDLRLKLVRIHKDKVSYIKKDDAYFACTDFTTEDGKSMYDLDFWMKKNAEGGLDVYQTKIHKKDGEPRFTYKDDEIVEVKQ